MQKTRRSQLEPLPLVTLAVLAAILFSSAASMGQVQSSSAELERDLRFQQLEQYNLDMRERADLTVPADQRLLFDYGAYVTYNYLSVDDRTGNNHGLRQGELFAYGRANLDDAQEVFVRTRIGFLDYNRGDDFDAPNNYQSIGFDLDRGYYRFDLRKYNSAYGTHILGGSPDADIVIEGGRDLAYWANGLVLAEVIDGVMVDITKGPFELQAIAGVTPVRTVDFDSSRPAFYYNTRRGFFGGVLSAQLGSIKPYVYGLVERDFNSDNESVTGPITTRFAYNSHYIGTGATGSIGDHIRYGLEVTVEGGNTLSNSFQLSPLGGAVPVQQTMDPIRAWGLDGRMTYLPADTHQTRYEVELIATSGDTNRGDSSTTFNGAAPGRRDYAFNGFGLLNTGLAFGAEPSNLLVLRMGGSTFPLPQSQLFKKLQAGMDFFVMGKTRQNAAIDEPTGNKRYLGVEPDFYLNWQATSDVTLAARYGVFVPSGANFPRSEARQFLYFSVTYGF